MSFIEFSPLSMSHGIHRGTDMCIGCFDLDSFWSSERDKIRRLMKNNLQYYITTIVTVRDLMFLFDKLSSSYCYFLRCSIVNTS